MSLIVGREAWLLFAIQTINNTGFSASFPFIAIYLLDVRKVPLSEIGFIYLIAGALSVVGQILGGRLTDSLGIKKMLLLEFSLSIGIFFLTALLILQNGSVLLLFVAYPLLFLLNSASQLTSASIVADYEVTQLSSGFALLYIALNLGYTIGPALGGILVTGYGYYSLFILGAVSSFGAVLLSWKGLRKNVKYALRPKPDIVSKRINGVLIVFLLLAFTSWLVIAFVAIPLSVYASRFLNMSNMLIGYLLATNGLLIVVLQLPLSRLIRGRRTIVVSLVLASALQSVGYLVLTVVQTFIGLELVITLVTLGEILVAVPSQVLVASYSRGYNRGAYQGYYYAISRAGISTASFIGPLSFGLLLVAPYISWYFVSAAAIATGAGFAILTPRMQSARPTGVSKSSDPD